MTNSFSRIQKNIWVAPVSFIFLVGALFSFIIICALLIFSFFAVKRLLSPQPTILWKYEANSFINTKQDLSDGILYLGNLGFPSTYFGVNLKTGQERWRYTRGGSVQSEKAVAFRKNLYLTDKNTLLVLDGLSGEELWQIQVNGSKVYGDSGKSVFLAGLEDGKHYLFAYNLKTGKEEWRFPFEGFTNYGIVSSKAVYIIDQNGVIFSIDLLSGIENWHYNLRQPSYAYDHPIAYTNQVCVKDLALDVNTGQPQSLFPSCKELLLKSGGNIQKSPGKITIEDGNSIYKVTNNLSCFFCFDSSVPYLSAIDRKSGKIRWKREEPIDRESILVNDGIVFFKSKNFIYAAQ